MGFHILELTDHRKPNGAINNLFIIALKCHIALELSNSGLKWVKPGPEWKFCKILSVNVCWYDKEFP